MTEPTAIVPIILSGGSGTRLWPESRALQPKQLLDLIGSTPLIGQTIARVSSVEGVLAPLIVTNAAQAGPIERILAHTGVAATLILEPIGRNTAPAVAIAALTVIDRWPGALILVLPSDHAIGAPDVFVDAVAHGARLASDGRLVTFGISPTSPETGFGYIRAGEPIDDRSWTIAEFKEKPDLDTARGYVESGMYSWNSGMFLMGAQQYLDELDLHRPDIALASRAAYAAATEHGRRIDLDQETFSACPSDSIDYAVMESTAHGAVVPIEPQWSDVGSWSSLWSIAPKDVDGNEFVGDVVASGTTNSLVRTRDRLVAVVGLDGVVVVDTPDALLVTTLESSQDVKAIVDGLAAADRREVVTDGTEIHDWGTATPVATAPGVHVTVLRLDADSRTPTVPADALTHLRILDGEGTVIIDDATTMPARGELVVVEPGSSWSAITGEKPLLIIASAVDTVVSIEALDAFVKRRFGS
ncbi:MAG TPA: mannose-1-phosphate guanylyltransferase/mannose-6-phosphate isomerase [Acidimicrobiia bacterium]|nr:mannose-1-phosphate guanylyltransferase/mannose-6-phosphate isomerase [Acidimicrobiia bacterium]